MRLTELAQAAVRELLRPGDLAIDATAGNGHDTLFLAQVVGAEGTVWACDVQEPAIAATRMLLAIEGHRHVELFREDHSQLASRLPESARGQISAVMFNLGYLPGGDKSVTTLADSTRTALDSLWDFVRPGGIVTILAYPGHAGGEAESRGVDAFAASLRLNGHDVTIQEGPPGKAPSPRLTIVRRSTTRTDGSSEAGVVSRVVGRT